jgi:hypothetical protein
MRAKTSLIAASLTGVLLLGQALAWSRTTAAGYQGSVARNSQDDMTPRGLYISKSADAIRVKVLDAKTGATVSPSREFTTDDTLKVIIESNFESYAYIVNVEIVKDSKRRFLLYPNPRTVNNRITAASRSIYQWPSTRIRRLKLSRSSCHTIGSTISMPR